MDTAAIVFWLSVLLIAYTYLLYPLAIWLLAAWRPRRRVTTGPVPASVSLIVAARNEWEQIAAKSAALLAQLDTAGVEGEVIVVLDGPGCPETVVQRMCTDGRVRVIELSENRGKAAAISEGARHAQGEILAFSDVRQRWQHDALARLLTSFHDPTVGAVSGELILESSRGVNQGVGLYWRYEKWLRHNEAQFDSVVGVTGAICAVRRNLFDAVPAGMVLDDVYWPLKVVMRGYCVDHNRDALAYDRLPKRAVDEFHRKVRTLSGSLQLVQVLPSLFLPWGNRLWWQFTSHKLLRLAVPWMMIFALVASGLASHGLYRLMCAVQMASYATVAAAMATGISHRSRILAAATSFLVLNAAAWLALWVWLSGGCATSWKATSYLNCTASRP